MSRLNKTLRAGAARVEITPRFGTHIGGKGLFRPAHLAIDPLFARALVVESEGRQICLVTLEVCAVAREYADQIRQRAVEAYGFEMEGVMVHALQVHAAPFIGHLQMSESTPYVPAEYPWIKGGDDAYSEWVIPRIISSIDKAVRALQPVRVSVGTGIEGRVASNRRVVYRDGTANAIGIEAGDPNILYLEGPMDPELGVVCMTGRESARPLSMLLYHTCHPCHLNGTNNLCASWPGAWCREMNRAFGNDFVPIVINGSCGNIHHRHRLDPDPASGSNYRIQGRFLAETTREVLINRMVEVSASPLDYTTKQIPIPIRDLGEEKVAEAKRFVETHPDPVWNDNAHTSIDWEWIYAVALLELAERKAREPNFNFEIQVFRIGNVAIVGLPAEIFVEGQLEIKLLSPAFRTFLAHYANDFAGYVPTAHAFPRGGYETWTTNASQLVPEALEIIVKATSDLLREMFSSSFSKS